MQQQLSTDNQLCSSSIPLMTNYVVVAFYLQSASQQYYFTGNHLCSSSILVIINYIVVAICWSSARQQYYLQEINNIVVAFFRQSTSQQYYSIGNQLHSSSIQLVVSQLVVLFTGNQQLCIAIVDILLQQYYVQQCCFTDQLSLSPFFPPSSTVTQYIELATSTVVVAFH